MIFFYFTKNLKVSILVNFFLKVEIIMLCCLVRKDLIMKNLEKSYSEFLKIFVVKKVILLYFCKCKIYRFLMCLMRYKDKSY